MILKSSALWWDAKIKKNIICTDTDDLSRCTNNQPHYEHGLLIDAAMV